MARHRLLPVLFRDVLLTCARPSSLRQSIRWARQLSTTLKTGQTILLRQKLYTVIKAAHSLGTGRQVGNVQLELRDLKTHLKHTERLRSAEDVEIAFLASDKWTVLYIEADTVTCMHPKSFEQVTMPLRIFGEQRVFVSEGVEVTVESYSNEPVAGQLPKVVEIAVAEVNTESGDNFRHTTLSNGHILKMPSYVQPGDVVAVNTREGVFVKRLRS